MMMNIIFYKSASPPKRKEGISNKTRTTMKYIYPNVNIKSHSIDGLGETTLMETTLRKKYRGKWYLWEFYKICHEYSSDKSSVVNTFHAEVYNHIILGKISLKLVNTQGERIFKLDSNQESEEERLMKFLRISKK